MTSTLPTVENKKSPYYRMALPFNPITRETYAYNPSTGKELPHAKEKTQNEQFAALDPLIQQNIHTLIESQKAAQMQKQIPELSMQPKGSKSKVSQAAKSVIKQNPNAKKATTAHSFNFKKQLVKFKEDYTDFDAQGVAYQKKVDPLTWSRIEKLYSKQLEKNPHLLSEKAEVIHLGFSKYSNGVYFEVYYKLHGVIKKSGVAANADDIQEAENIANKYSKVFIPPLRKAEDVRVVLKNADLKKMHFKTLGHNDDNTGPVALAMHQEVIRQAEKLQKDHSIVYSYPEKQDVHEKLIQQKKPNFSIDQLTQKEFEIGDIFSTSSISAPKKKNEVRIFHGTPPRSGKHPHELIQSEERQFFSENYPLEHMINSNLGHLDKSDAPKTAHYKDVFIATKDKKGKIKSSVFLQDGFEIPEIEELENNEKYQALKEAIINQYLRYAQIRNEHQGSLFISIRDPIGEYHSVDDQGDLYLSIYIRMAAALLTNSLKTEDMPLIRLDFEFPLEHQEAANMMDIYSLVLKEITSSPKNSVGGLAWRYASATELVEDFDSDSDGDSTSYHSCDQVSNLN